MNPANLFEILHKQGKWQDQNDKKGCISLKKPGYRKGLKNIVIWTHDKGRYE